MKKLTALLIATLMLLTLFGGCSFLNKKSIPDITPPEDVAPSPEELEENIDLRDIQAAAEKKADEIRASILETVDNFAIIFTEELHIKADETYTKKLDELRDCIIKRTEIKCTEPTLDKSDKTKATVKITVSIPNLENLFANEKLATLLDEARRNAQSEGNLTPYISILDTLIESINAAEIRSVSGTGILEKNADGVWETTEILEDYDED